jgi:hypothetical protein
LKIAKGKKSHLANISCIKYISGQPEVVEVKFFFMREFQLMAVERIIEL